MRLRCYRSKVFIGRSLCALVNSLAKIAMVIRITCTSTLKPTLNSTNNKSLIQSKTTKSFITSSSRRQARPHPAPSKQSVRCFSSACCETRSIPSSNCSTMVAQISTCWKRRVDSMCQIIRGNWSGKCRGVLGITTWAPITSS